MKQQSISRSEVLTTAHAIKRQEGVSFSEAQRLAWRAIRLKTALKSGPVSFQYTKADGSLRQATGTTNPELFTYENKGSDKPAPAILIRYYDFEAGGYRSCRADRLDRIAA